MFWLRCFKKSSTTKTQPDEKDLPVSTLRRQRRKFLLFNFFNKVNCRLVLWVNVGKGAWAVNGKVVVIDSIDFDKVSTLAHFVNERIRRVDIDKLAPVRRAKSESSLVLRTEGIMVFRLKLLKIVENCFSLELWFFSRNNFPEKLNSKWTRT